MILIFWVNDGEQTLGYLFYFSETATEQRDIPPLSLNLNWVMLNIFTWTIVNIIEQHRFCVYIQNTYSLIQSLTHMYIRTIHILRRWSENEAERRQRNTIHYISMFCLRFGILVAIHMHRPTHICNSRCAAPRTAVAFDALPYKAFKQKQNRWKEWRRRRKKKYQNKHIYST